MDKQRAKQILESHQAWRKGKIDDMQNTPKEIGEAIEFVIDLLGQSNSYEPDWSQAPDWANYYGIDADGQRWWYELEPELKGITYNSKGEFNVDNLPDRMKLYKRPTQ